MPVCNEWAKPVSLNLCHRLEMGRRGFGAGLYPGGSCESRRRGTAQVAEVGALPGSGAVAYVVPMMIASLPDGGGSVSGAGAEVY